MKLLFFLILKKTINKLEIEKCILCTVFWKLLKISILFFFVENAWCPKIYYNHKCFSGPYLSKGRIASLPKCVGPGPVGLVMKEVLTNLINVAYKSFRVLKELQLEGKPNPRMQQQTIKAKWVALLIHLLLISFLHNWQARSLRWIKYTAKCSPL